jgi:hypothetical protein
MHAISGLAQPLLKQSACELVFLVKQYVHGILGSPRGAWYRPHAAQAILRRAPHAIMSASRGSVSTETRELSPPARQRPVWTYRSAMCWGGSHSPLKFNSEMPSFCPMRKLRRGASQVFLPESLRSHRAQARKYAQHPCSPPSRPDA